MLLRRADRQETTGRGGAGGRCYLCKLYIDCSMNLSSIYQSRMMLKVFASICALKLIPCTVLQQRWKKPWILNAK